MCNADSDTGKPVITIDSDVVHHCSGSLLLDVEDLEIKISFFLFLYLSAGRKQAILGTTEV